MWELFSASGKHPIKCAMMLATTFGSLEYVHMYVEEESPIEPVSSKASYTTHEYDGVAAYLLASFNDKLGSPLSRTLLIAHRERKGKKGEYPWKGMEHKVCYWSRMDFGGERQIYKFSLLYSDLSRL